MKDNKGPRTCEQSTCKDCILENKLMCRYEKKDSVHFLMILFPFFLTSILGIIQAGLAIWIIAWIAYGFVFFFGIEAYVLCRHCPYWKLEGKKLKCHANYGVLKLMKHTNKPMTLADKVLFVIFGSLYILIPLVIILIGGQYILFAIGLASAISAIYLLKRNICVRCINLSCPLNSVPNELKEEYLNQNVEMGKVWRNEK